MEKSWTGCELHSGSMSASSGWYPDPGGQPGMFRVWDGAHWSASLSATPQAPPPLPPGAAPATTPVGPLGPAAYAGGGVPALTPKKRPYGWILGLLAVVVALIVVIALVVTRVTGDPSGPTGPGGAPSTEICPEQQNESPLPQPGDGRVHGGKLSYPLLGAPWSPPEPNYQVAFGRGVLMQSVVVEKSQPQNWLAAVLIGQLMAGDGFFTPKDGAAIVVKCVSGTFYGNSEVTRNDKKNQAMKVDGHDAWLVESQLGFDVPGVQAKSELLIVVIVDTGDGTAGLFYASIPENSPQLVQPARDALAALKVDD
jgi:hypothetical protein